MASKKSREKLLSIESVRLENYKFSYDKSEKIVLLGEGGSGIVYKAEQEFVPNVSCSRAIKFFIFKDKLIERFGKYVSTMNFEDEIVNISKFNHQNILKIIDGGYLNRDGVNIPYIVSDFVKGETLESLLLNESLLKEYFAKKELIFDLFRQTLNGLIYLHNRNFYHCDIAPKNIFINILKEGLHVIIGDLGVGQTLNDESKKHSYLVTGTREYMPAQVEKLKDKKVNYAIFSTLQPGWDIYAVRKTFLECIEKIFGVNEISRSELAWLNALVSILKKEYPDLNALNNAIERVRPIHRTIAGLPELSESDSGSWRKLVPLKDVLFTKRVNKIANHPSLLRLKKVPQLLMGSTIFPGSNHTRYEHSLGTYENMRRVLLGLLKKEGFIELFSKEVLELALVSALLANITRFPFSFAIHELKNSDKTLFKRINKRGLFDLVMNYKEINTGFKFSLLDTVNEYFSVDTEVVKKIICGSKSGFQNPEIQLVNSLLNSSIDVRVLDFLQRDPHHLGMSNGFQFDFESLINFLTTYNNKIAIQSPGVSYVEQVISSRYWLYKNIYWNEPNRSYTSMLKQVIFNLQTKPEFEEKLLSKFMFSTPLGLLDYFEEVAINMPKTLDIISLINSNRPRIFKRVFLINKSEEDSILSGICDTISKMKYSQLDELRMELEEKIGEIIPFDKKKTNLLIDIPTDENTKLGKDINVIKYDLKPTKLTNLSGIVNGINNYFDSHLQWLRVYIHPQYKRELYENSNKKLVENTIKEFLVRKLG